MEEKSKVEQLREAQAHEAQLQEIGWELHTGNNCSCERETGDTFTLKAEGAGDIKMCLDCFGAIGCVY